MANQITLTWNALRKITGWDSIDFVEPSDEVTVFLPSRAVQWLDSQGCAQELGTITVEQLERVVASEIAADALWDESKEVSTLHLDKCRKLG